MTCACSAWSQRHGLHRCGQHFRHTNNRFAFDGVIVGHQIGENGLLAIQAGQDFLACDVEMKARTMKKMIDKIKMLINR